MGHKRRFITWNWELAHAIMEAEKSRDLLSASWRPRSADGLIPVLGTRGTDGINPSPKAGEDRSPNSNTQAGREKILPSFAFLFYLGPQWTR